MYITNRTSDLESPAQEVGMPFSICQTEATWRTHPYGLHMSKLPIVPRVPLPQRSAPKSTSNEPFLPRSPSRPLSGLKVLCATHARRARRFRSPSDLHTWLRAQLSVHVREPRDRVDTAQLQQGRRSAPHVAAHRGRARLPGLISAGRDLEVRLHRRCDGRGESSAHHLPLEMLREDWPVGRQARLRHAGQREQRADGRDG